MIAAMRLFSSEKGNEKVFLYDRSGRSCAMEACEPCQVRKEAALSGSLHAPRGRLPCGLTGKPAESSL